MKFNVYDADGIFIYSTEEFETVEQVKASDPAAAKVEPATTTEHGPRGE